MKANELFNLINHVNYKTVGDFVDYFIFYDTETKQIFLLFQPSYQKRDWINNFNFPVKLYKNQKNKILVARGWGDAYKSANDVIMQELIELIAQYDCISIIIIGWSYGGAMAQLAAEDLYFRTNIKSNVVTFGSPKPLFSKATLKHFKSCVKTCINYEHVNDCVPLLPPFPNYHSITPVQIGQDEKRFKELFNPQKWHCIYFDEKYY